MKRLAEGCPVSEPRALLVTPLPRSFSGVRHATWPQDKGKCKKGTEDGETKQKNERQNCYSQDRDFPSRLSFLTCLSAAAWSCSADSLPCPP